MTLRFASWTHGLSLTLFLGVVLAQEQPIGDGKEGKEKETPPTLSSSSREDKTFADLDKKPEFKGKAKPTDMVPEVLPGERLYQMLMSLDGDNDKKLSQREFQRLPQTLPPPISFAVAPRTRDI